ncbi:MAG: ATP-binding cassette domain-containing protein [Clostridiales bacterium]|nr:ATP-binding cassette domain-containing protein [Clostridiales bacterium]
MSDTIRSEAAGFTTETPKAEDSVISVHNLTKDYGHERGVFDISLDIHKGEVFGYLGTNGSGKTTTIRHMMGFLKPDSGTVTVKGLDPWKKTPEVMKSVSYIPGEIAFPDLKTGTDFFKVQAQFLGVQDFTYMNHLIDMLGLDPAAVLKRMSKGMKQKTAIVAALMGNREVLIMDEPTTGLDPLMRETFLELVREEKAKGRTIFMSSHIFEEIEDVCDRVAIINAGRICDVVNLSEFRHGSVRTFDVEFADETASRTYYERLIKISDADTWNPDCTVNGSHVRFCALAKNVDEAFRAIDGLAVVSMSESHTDLEEYFMKTIQSSN